MPVFKHSVTGQKAELTADYVSAFPEGTWDEVEKEGPNEKRERQLREAITNKVEIEPDDAEVEADNRIEAKEAV